MQKQGAGNFDEGELKETFALFDADHSGTISTSEIMHMLKTQLGAQITPEEAKAIVHTIDRNGDGEVDLDEFIGAMSSNQHGKDDDDASIAAMRKFRSVVCVCHLT
jgi:Ca2+-binding EF-hand superfamily protein